VEVERELTNLLSAIKQGVVTVSKKAELEKAERERSRLLRMMQSHTAKADNVTTLLPKLKNGSRSSSATWRTFLANMWTRRAKCSKVYWGQPSRSIRVLMVRSVT
jgi:hypothetical protein